MTDSIDLDDLDVGDEDDDGAATEANYGDWLWRGEGDPEDEPEPGTDPGLDLESASGASGGPRDATADAGDDATGVAGDDTTGDAPGSARASSAEQKTEDPDESSPTRRGSPGVPATSDGPVGVPESQGGSGGGRSRESARGGVSPEDSGVRQGGTAAAHGEDVSEMTLAFTYDAVRRLADTQAAVSDARGWSDWIGVVGDVPTPTLRKLQREEYVDLDFFGGAETGPGARLADVDPASMFFAERMVVVGIPDDEWIADEAGWEFVPLETAAGKAGWEIEGGAMSGTRD